MARFRILLWMTRMIKKVMGESEAEPDRVRNNRTSKHAVSRTLFVQADGDCVLSYARVESQLRSVGPVRKFDSNMSVKSVKEQVINDSIHGHIRMPPVAMVIVDTPQFQRLRSIKQVGTCHWVYPAATHTRFQHSLGVGYLAQKFALELQRQMPSLVDDMDVVCVLLAGLCHDLGHGPFSHVWEKYVNYVDPSEDWHHEDSSIKMLTHLIEDNALGPVLSKRFGIKDADILFIKELIAGPIDETADLPLRNCDPFSKDWPYRGRGEEKSFLYEIVANKISGIDVDKWDYFLRDDTNLQIGHTFNYERCITYSRVLETGDPPRRHICIQEKEAKTLRNMFHDRARLHEAGYQHRVTKLLDQMLVDALILADKHVMTEGDDGRLYSLSECQRNIVAFSKLTDYVFERVLYSDCPEAVNILRRIQKRDLCRVVVGLLLPLDHQLLEKSNEQICSEVKRCVEANGCQSLQPQDIFVVRREVTFGMGNRDPMLGAKFYRLSKTGVNVGSPVKMNLSSHDTMLDRTIWICCRKNEAEPLREASNAIRQWCVHNVDELIAVDYY